MRAIVTGGAGFIGSHLVEALLERGDEPVVIDNLARGKRQHVPDEVELIERDIREPLGDLFARVRPEVCFHLAAQADVRVSVERPGEDAAVNVLGSIEVLSGAAKVGAKVVFSSTGGAIYGECERPAREDDPLEPVSPYGAAKLAAETYVATWTRLHGGGHAVLRYANVYGPRQEAGLEGGVIAIFLERMRDDRPTTIYGDGRQTRDFVHVSDVVAATIAGVDAEGVFNVGTGIETPIAELHEACRLVTGSSRDPEPAPERLGEIHRSVLDPTRARERLGWSAALALDEGLKRTWSWYREGARTTEV